MVPTGHVALTGLRWRTLYQATDAHRLTRQCPQTHAYNRNRGTCNVDQSQDDGCAGSAIWGLCTVITASLLRRTEHLVSLQQQGTHVELAIRPAARTLRSARRSLWCGTVKKPSPRIRVCRGARQASRVSLGNGRSDQVSDNVIDSRLLLPDSFGLVHHGELRLVDVPPPFLSSDMRRQIVSHGCRDNVGEHKGARQGVSSPVCAIFA